MIHRGENSASRRFVSSIVFDGVTSREEDGQAPKAELGRVEVDHPRNLQLDALDARRRWIDLAVDGQQRVELARAGGGRRPAHVHLEDDDAAAGIVWQTRAAARVDAR